MRTSLTLLALLAALVAAPTALAKGADKATISGPGIKGSVQIPGFGEGPPTSPLGAVVNYGGFFPQVFEQQPDPTTRERPDGKLGPRYRIAYSVPGPAGDRSTVFQDVYPFAKPNPVTYVKPGQRMYGGEHETYGGWYVADPRLRGTLERLGVKPGGATATDGGLGPWTITGITLAALLGTALAAAVVLAARRGALGRPATS